MNLTVITLFGGVAVRHNWGTYSIYSCITGWNGFEYNKLHSPGYFSKVMVF